MSYQHHDHAEWVAAHNAGINRQWASSKSKRKPPTLPTSLTDFQARAMDILGMTFGGIYNAPIHWEKVEWLPGDRGIVVPLDSWHRSMATWDYHQLTLFVFLCHEARIRGSIEANKFKPLTICLHQRSQEGGVATRHPNLDEAIAAFRAYLPAKHRILYGGHVRDDAAGQVAA